MTALHRSLAQLFDLDEDERKHLDRLQERDVERFVARRTVLAQRTQHSTAYVVVSGWLAEHRTLRDGKRQILNIRMAGDLIGIDGLTFRKAIFATSALTDVELVPIPLEAFHGLLQKAPRLGSRILVQTLRTEALLREWEVNLGRRSAAARLAHLLLELRERQELRGLATGHRRVLPLTQGELSDCLGVTAEHVNRMMRTLREDGVARMEDGDLVVDDGDELKRRAGFEPDYLDD